VHDNHARNEAHQPLVELDERARRLRDGKRQR
jgi:hypothetical protein